MKREIITIDEDQCNGCGQCIPGCPEGALQLIDGKARLVSDLMCDGLGACVGDCPTGALTVEEREAAPYDEKKVMVNIMKAGDNTIRAHLAHLKDHGETAYFQEAIDALKEAGLDPDNYVTKGDKPAESRCGGGCPGSQVIDKGQDGALNEEGPTESAPSQLRQWPVQLHLVPPNAPYYQKADVLLAADCVAYAMGDFHRAYLKGKALAIACPKLDAGQESYVQKIQAMIDEAKVNTITVMMMQVPCCNGLLNMVKKAAAQASRKVPIKAVTVGLDGQPLKEAWL